MLGAMILLDAARAFIDANQAVIGLILLGLMFIGFVIERFPATVVAIMGSCAFLFLGILDAEGLFSVFSNPAPITIGAMRSEEHTSELQSLMRISYAVFCLKKKNK